MPNSIKCLFALCGIALLAAHTHAQNAPAAANLKPGVIAKVNAVELTEAQLQRAVQLSGLPDSPTLRAALKDQMVSRELFRQQAEKTHRYEQRPEVKQAMQEAKDLAITQLYLRDAIKPAPVTDAQIKARFDGIIASLGAQEYKARLIQVADDAAASAALAQLKAGADFGQLAQSISLAANKVRGGELDWISFKLPAQEGQTQSLPLPIAQAIAQLPAGGISAAPVSWNNSSYIVKLEQVRPTQVPQYDAVKATLRQMLEAQALEKATIELVSGLVQAAKIQQ
ncbi:peptidyl-prolyl cis-trans isomerase [Paraherbaspirillum soli]|uniref:peptidylprolyl isomerase n=1 Tax=Paraherbaspirillum soli TaxID=631222 RepID=A0ABW0MFT3_9BURK